MGTRIRSKRTIQHLYSHYIIFEQRWKKTPSSGQNDHPGKLVSSSGVLESIAKFVYPPPVKDEEHELIERVKSFAFPTDEKCATIENFSFVLTNGGGEWTFGYCRLQPGGGVGGEACGQECVMILSSIPYWNTLFYKILNYAVYLRNWSDVHESFLRNLYQSSVVESALGSIGGSGSISIESNQSLPPFVATCPNLSQLPSTLDNRCLAEFYNSLNVDSMITLFASLLAERRIFITSSKLSRLSSIVLACNILLYPMCWQHVLIPVLPASLSDYLETPCPIIVGVPLQTWRNGILSRKLSQSNLNDIVHVDADANDVFTPFPEDVLDLPNDLLTFLKSNLKIVRKIGADGLAKVFLHTFVRLMGHVENSLVIDKNQLKLDDDNFIHLAKSSHRKYIKKKLLHSQMFHEFVEELIVSIKAGRSRNDDLFFQEVSTVTGICGSSCGRKNTLPREKVTGKLHKSRTHSQSSNGVLNISDPLPVTPDLIRFNDLTISSSVTLPRTKADNRNNNNYFEATINPTSSASQFFKSNSLTTQQGTNSEWNSSVWNPIANDNVQIVNTNSSQQENAKDCASSNGNTEAALMMSAKLKEDEDLIKLEDTTTTTLEASVRKYEDLLREYGLYDFYTQPT